MECTEHRSLPGITNNPVFTLRREYSVLYYILLPYIVDIFYMTNAAFKLLFFQGWVDLMIPERSYCVALTYLMKFRDVKAYSAPIRWYL